MNSMQITRMLLLFMAVELCAQSSSPCVISFPANTEEISEYIKQPWQSITLFTPEGYKKRVYRVYRTSLGEEKPLYEHTFQGKILYRDTIKREGGSEVIYTANLKGAWRSPKYEKTYIFLEVEYGILYSEIFGSSIIIFETPNFRKIELELKLPEEISFFVSPDGNWVMILVKEFSYLSAPPSLEGLVIDISGASSKRAFRLSRYLGQSQDCITALSKEKLALSQQIGDFLAGKAVIWVGSLCARFRFQEIRAYEVESDKRAATLIVPIQWSSDESICSLANGETDYKLKKPIDFIVLMLKW